MIDLKKVPQEHLDTLNEVLRQFRAEKISRVRFTNDVITYYDGPSDSNSVYLPLETADLVSICKVILPFAKEITELVIS